MNSESTTMTKEEIRLMLQTNSKGAVMQSLGNCMLVFQNDPLLKGSIRRNSLTERIDIEKDLGWCRSDTAVTDTDINYLQLYFEENYSITAEKNIQCALDIVANEAHYHPICDVLLGLQWDGEARICNALTKFLGVEKTPYTTEAFKIFLLGAIQRVFHPGSKFDTMLCLVGGQGAGKSTFIRLLAMNDSWFSDDIKKLSDDNLYRVLYGHWIIEMAEMLATANARSIEEIKSFLSRQKDTYKVPYEKYPSVMNIKQTVERANTTGINISEYTLRRAIRTRQLPCKIIGRTYLIPWDAFLRWVNCEQ